MESLENWKKTQNIMSKRIKEHVDKYLNLKELMGSSDKQIKWANDIRYKFADYFLPQEDNRKLSVEELPGITNIENMINKQLESFWWIDRRNMSTNDLLKELKESF